MRAVEVDRHTISVLRRTLDSREDRPLAAHALDHRVDVVLGRPSRSGARPQSVTRRFDLDLRHHLEDRRVLEVRARAHRDRLDPRTAGRRQLLLAQRLREGAAHQVAHRPRRAPGRRTACARPEAAPFRDGSPSGAPYGRCSSAAARLAVETSVAGTATSRRRSRPPVAVSDTCINEYPRKSQTLGHAKGGTRTLTGFPTGT